MECTTVSTNIELMQSILDELSILPHCTPKKQVETLRLIVDQLNTEYQITGEETDRYVFQVKEFIRKELSSNSSIRTRVLLMTIPCFEKVFSILIGQ